MDHKARGGLHASTQFKGIDKHQINSHESLCLSLHTDEPKLILKCETQRVIEVNMCQIAFPLYWIEHAFCAKTIISTDNCLVSTSTEQCFANISIFIFISLAVALETNNIMINELIKIFLCTSLCHHTLPPSLPLSQSDQGSTVVCGGELKGLFWSGSSDVGLYTRLCLYLDWMSDIMNTPDPTPEPVWTTAAAATTW